MNDNEPREPQPNSKTRRPLFSFWGFRLGCATAYWAAALVVLTSGFLVYLNTRSGKPFNTDSRATWVMVGLLIMLTYHQIMGWWPFRRRVNPEYAKWLAARRRREEAESEAAAAAPDDQDEEAPEEHEAGSQGGGGSPA